MRSSPSAQQPKRVRNRPRKRRPVHLGPRTMSCECLNVCATYIAETISAREGALGRPGKGATTESGSASATPSSGAQPSDPGSEATGALRGSRRVHPVLVHPKPVRQKDGRWARGLEESASSFGEDPDSRASSPSNSSRTSSLTRPWSPSSPFAADGWVTRWLPEHAASRLSPVGEQEDEGEEVGEDSAESVATEVRLYKGCARLVDHSNVGNSHSGPRRTEPRRDTAPTRVGSGDTQSRFDATNRSRSASPHAGSTSTLTSPRGLRRVKRMLFNSSAQPGESGDPASMNDCPELDRPNSATSTWSASRSSPEVPSLRDAYHLPATGRSVSTSPDSASGNMEQHRLSPYSHAGPSGTGFGHRKQRLGDYRRSPEVVQTTGYGNPSPKSAVLFSSDPVPFRSRTSVRHLIRD